MNELRAAVSISLARLFAESGLGRVVQGERASRESRPCVFTGAPLSREAGSDGFTSDGTHRVTHTELLAIDNAQVSLQVCFADGSFALPFPKDNTTPRLSTRCKCLCPKAPRARRRCRRPITCARPSVRNMSSASFHRPGTAIVQVEPSPRSRRRMGSKVVRPRREATEVSSPASLQHRS